MCGIAGAYWFRSDRPVDEAFVARMCGTIVHRGPDDEGHFVSGNLGIGMRRLSIIDLGGGRQPVFNEDRSVAVVFNGEIYNFQELRQRLEAQGHKFSTRTDTEAIVHLYEQYGDRFPEHLNGMFAIALWDIRRRRLVLVRDRLGKKPLYYAETSDGLVFGSELKCLLEEPGVARDLDRAAIYHYFTLGYIPHPFSIYKQVRQLPPASRMVIDDQSVQIDNYWRLPTHVDRTLVREEVRDELRDLLIDATRIRMISDVPLGAFLSGGVDSSITVALMAQASAAPVKTFHIDFAEPEFSANLPAPSPSAMEPIITNLSFGQTRLTCWMISCGISTSLLAILRPFPPGTSLN
jgi:asparagine synthase (glutamine-hydrolysing)